ncbi:MAG: sigma-70 family RNA polymerase sigma factor, partial [Candidatus Omnitrophica bacterium]|nr:sigma-70 family RNA polymerase sigma factor [Candidatus Omnitrophota bacterium]
MTDEELIHSYYDGNQGALAVIFERHNQGVFSFAWRMLGNRADAEDTASEVFSRLCTSQARYSPNAAFKTWLYTIARNVCLDRIRSRNKSGSLWVQNRETETYEQIDIP